jgi:glycosyltransferase involved in cell wall biosynthesis
MTTHLHRDDLAKKAGRAAYSGALGVHAIASIPSSGHGTAPRVFYGGARAGDQGGPLVKVQRLSAHFAEHPWRYNIAYVLSNAPYLPDLAFALLKARGIPVVHNQDGVFYPAWYGGDWQSQNRRMARSFHGADHVFYQSEFCRRAAHRFLGGREGPGEILYNAVDTDRFRPQADAARERPGGMTFLLTGKIGTHLFYRLQSTLLGLAEARKRGLEAKLVIAGALDAAAQGAARQAIAEYRLDDCVRMVGAYSQAAAPTLYASAQAYITTKHQDPCPNAVLEALACGLPVLYSNTGGVPELVGGDAGVALECAEDWERPQVPSTSDIADGMLRIAGNVAQMSSAARARAVARFDIRAWLDRHDRTFRQLLRRRGENRA